MAGIIRDDAEHAIRAAFPEIATVLIEIDPSRRWSHDRLTSVGRQQLLGESRPAAHEPSVAPNSVRIAGPTRVDRVAWPRLPVALISLVTLMLGLGGELVRMEINLPLADFAVSHGAVMVVGFLGTLHCFYWAWIGPIALAYDSLRYWNHLWKRRVYHRCAPHLADTAGTSHAHNGPGDKRSACVDRPDGSG